MLFFDIDSYNSFHCLPFTHDVNTKEKHILLKYGCEFPHSRIYLISTTHFHWFLNCCFIVGVTFDLAPLTASATSSMAYMGTLLAGIWQMPFADVLKVLLITTWSSSSARWQNIVSLYPMDAHGGEPAAAPCQVWWIARKKPKQTPAQTSITQLLWSVYLWYPFQISPSWRSSCNATIHRNVPIMLVWDFQCA